MIGGAVHGSGGAGLGTHNSAPQEADDARPGMSRGLMAQGIQDQTAELRGYFGIKAERLMWRVG
ncbi:MAG: hypothetical protein DDT25_00869 [Chloroflexi bacterium]|nr:hypothetical protein [Chloroflexota bacterium]